MRHMIQSNISAFDNLRDDLKLNFNIVTEDGKRYIKTDDNEKEWLKKIEIEESLRILPNLSVVKLIFEDSHYYAFIGIEISEAYLDTDVVRLRDTNAGLITVLLDERIIKIKKGTSGLYFFDEIMFQHIDKGYKGHDYSDLIPYLDPLTFFEIPKTSILFNTSLYRISTYLLSKNNQILVLDFNIEILDFFTDLALMGSNKISFELCVSSILSTNYKHSFLELYRLIERLFSIKYLEELYYKLDIKTSFIEFASDIEETIGWKPKEDDAIEKLFESTSDATKLLFQCVIDEIPAVIKTPIAKYFYKLRNSIVHFRANHNEADMNVAHWQSLILGTLYLIDEHYSKNNKILYK